MKKASFYKSLSTCTTMVPDLVGKDQELILRYRVISEVGPQCTSRTDGYRLFWAIWHDLSINASVQLDFAGVTSFSYAFFDSLYGTLLKYFWPFVLVQRIHPQNLSPVGWKMLKSTFIT